MGIVKSTAEPLASAVAPGVYPLDWACKNHMPPQFPKIAEDYGEPEE